MKLLNGKIIHRNRVDLRPISVQVQPISAVPVSIPPVTPNAEPTTVTKPPNTDFLTVSQPSQARAPVNHVVILSWNLNQELQGLPVMSKVLF